MLSLMPMRLVWHTNKVSISLSCWYTNMVALKSYARAPLNKCYSRMLCAQPRTGTFAIPRSAVVTTNYPLVLAGKNCYSTFVKDRALTKDFLANFAFSKGAEAQKKSYLFSRDSKQAPCDKNVKKNVFFIYLL